MITDTQLRYILQALAPECELAKLFLNKLNRKGSEYLVTWVYNNIIKVNENDVQSSRAL